MAGSVESPLDPGQFADRRIVVGVCGGIAAYKVATVVSRLAQAGCEVTVAMTEAATRFVGPLTFESLSGRPVYLSTWDQIDAHDAQHVALARSVDAMLIAPATMNTLARLAGGFADDPVTLLAAAIDPGSTPILVAPSMNTQMFEQASTQRNMARLKEDGFRIIPPGDGWQACRTEGLGRLPEPESLLERLCSLFSE